MNIYNETLHKLAEYLKVIPHQSGNFDIKHNNVHKNVYAGKIRSLNSVFFSFNFKDENAEYESKFVPIKDLELFLNLNEQEQMTLYPELYVFIKNIKDVAQEVKEASL